MILFSALHIFLFIGFLKLFHEHFVPERALDCAVKEKAIVHETLTVLGTWLAFQIIIVLSKIIFSKISTLSMFIVQVCGNNNCQTQFGKTSGLWGPDDDCCTQ